MKLHEGFRFALAASLVLTAAASATIEVKVEAETYITHAWQDNGGDPIHIGFCESASEEWCADGVDKTGDWIQIYVYVPATGTYDGYLAFQAHAQTHDYLVSLWPNGREELTQTMGFNFTGEGAG